MPYSRDITCIVCPLGCVVTVTEGDTGALHCDGHECQRGEEYAQQEFRDPRRTVTTTVPVIGGRAPLVPVKTLEPVPVAEMRDVVAALHGVRVRAPIERGEIAARDAAATGVIVVATRSVAAA